MISKQDVLEVLSEYDKRGITVGVLGSHSALDVCDGARDEGLQNVVVCQKGRDALYTNYFRSREVNGLRKGMVDETLVLDTFDAILAEAVQKELVKRNTLFIPNRSFVVYSGVRRVEDEFAVPLVGTRDMLKIENRETERENYYWVSQQAGIPIPRQYTSKDAIDTLVMVKLHHKYMTLERGFFTAASPDEFDEKAQRLLDREVITTDALAEARIEQYIIGPVFNFNFFYSPLDDEVELLGIDFRFESNLDGLVRIPAEQQLELPKRYRDPLMIIVGHANASLRESLLERVYVMAERFVDFSKRHYSAPIIGPFCLQTIVDQNMDFYVYDIATRIGGGTNVHTSVGAPYGNSLFGTRMSSGRRLALEIKRALALDEVDKIVT
ncbi:MAG: formate--phosphoribosylaminoimidazolecarboxamide ligase family protein [Euryarchaeota archaeon]|nr:formate--phosphoribosylaminoimidazolecarboxamide ligase family protein [Euryarchaeota archaeon]